MAAKYPGRVTFVSENFGGSKLAERYGVKGYPAVFVDDVLVAVPRDFGYFGEVEGSGRYAPWKNADNQAKFKADLSRMIDLILAGKKDVVSQEHANTSAARARNHCASQLQADRPLRQASDQRAACRTRGAGGVLGDLVSALPLDLAVAGRIEAALR